MLKKALRLTTQEIKEVFAASNEPVHTSFFVLRFKTTSLPTGKFGVVVSRKMSTNAVDRNHKRRTLYNCIGNYLATHSVQQKNVILFPKSRFFTMPPEEQYAQMAYALGKLN